MAENKPPQQTQPQTQVKKTPSTFKNVTKRESQQDRDKRMGIDQSKEKRHFKTKADLTPEERQQVEDQGGGPLNNKKPTPKPEAPPEEPPKHPEAAGPAHTP